MQKLVKIFQQTFWQLLGKLVTTTSTFIILGLVARNYGPEGTGIFTLALTYLAIFYLLSDFGFNAHILRVGKQDLEWRKLLGTRLLWATCLVVVSILILPFLPFANSTFSQAIFYGSWAIMASATFVTCNLLFQKYLRFDLANLALSLGTMVALATISWFVKSHQPIPVLVFGHFVGWTIVALAALFLVKKFVIDLRPIFNKDYIISLFNSSWPIAATLALNTVYFRVDAFILSSVRTVSEVGIYNVAYQVFQSLLVLPTFAMNSFYPMMLQTLKFKMEKFKNQIKLAAALLTILSLGISIFTFYLSPVVIQLITGSGFAGSVTSLQILILGLPAYFLSALFMWVMVAKKMYKEMLFVYALGLVFNVLANYIFIPQYSYLAAAWITGASEYLILIMQAIILLRR
ncbi:flippase [Candidatus Daviesbacteria bacterium]|nr:flippase [Candidatus Daviesbacteria bacterium]